MTLREHFIATVIEESAQLNGTDFEKMCKIVFSMIIKHDVEQKGHNQYLKPVKGAVDFTESDSLGTVGQSGTDKDYYTDKNLVKSKPVKDIEGSLKNYPDCKVIYLFANKKQKGGEQVALRRYINNNYTQKIHIYDSERIANTIFDNIELGSKIELVLADLPKSLEYYNVLPTAHQIPQYNGNYCERKEYDDIIKLLNNNPIIQITGLSGIGKTEFAKCIAISQKKYYDTVLWIDGTSFDGNLNFVPILKDAKSVNLKFLLSISKILIVVDNLCKYQSTFIENFLNANKNGSKCIITTINQDSTHGAIYQLPYLTEDISKDILTMGLNIKKMPEDKQLKTILQKVKGYALLLKLIRKSVECGNYTWNDIVKNLSDITAMDDNETHQEVARRILDKYQSRFMDEFNMINSIGSTQISKDFFDKYSSIFRIKLLQDLTIIQPSDHYYSIHQIVLDSIGNLLKRNVDKKSAYINLLQYLKKCIDKPIGFYDLMYRNRTFVNEALNSKILDKEKKVIVYSILQVEDTYLEPQRYIKFIDKYLNDKSDEFYDILLNIEKLEIYLFSKKTDQKYKDIARNYAEQLMNSLLSQENFEIQKTILHHAGKLYYRAEMYNDAEKCYKKILKNDNNAYYALLQLARLYKKKNNNDVRICLKKIFEIGEDNIPLSTLLSSYELMVRPDFNDLKDDYIFNRQSIFEKKMLDAINIDSNQAFGTLSMLSSYLQFKLPEIFSELIDALPLATTIADRNHTKNAFSHAQLRFYQYKSFNDKTTDKAKRTFQLSLDYFRLCPLENDFQRKRLSDLYLEAGMNQEVLDMSEKFDDPNDSFYNMNKAKAFNALEEYNEAIKCINISISDKSKSPCFLAAFYHCKAVILYCMNDCTYTEVMKKAISSQNDKTTRNLWERELQEWGLK